VYLQSPIWYITRQRRQPRWHTPQPDKGKGRFGYAATKNVKDVQKLTGYMAALSRFISRLGEKGLPFFKLLKTSEKFVWSKQAGASFT
jgi:hypothetical protein